MYSPHNLLQEHLDSDPWKIFICCIFCNLTKRKSSEPIFWQVLEKWPTPDALSQAEDLELKNLIRPVGMVNKRAKALKMMSWGYNHIDWKNDPTKLYGIGKYAHDAYRIFVLNEWEQVKPTDGALKNYIKWKKDNELILS